LKPKLALPESPREQKSGARNDNKKLDIQPIKLSESRSSWKQPKANNEKPSKKIS
jgi:hypothetical protein